MLVFHKFTTEPHPCPYLPGLRAKLEYTYALQMDPREYERLMEEGYRKFGMACFRPVCEHCRLCRPLRIAVGRFQPDRSQRRTWQANRGLEVKLGEPRTDEQHVALFNRYHRAQARRKGWPLNKTDAVEYDFTYVRNPIPAVEISAWEGEALRAVVLADLTPNVVSAVYHYYEPGLPHRGLGTFCVLQTIELARRSKRRWVHLGYYVAGSASMEYKARFRPYEIMDENGVWREGGQTGMLGPAGEERRPARGGE